jgi:ubiquinone/menaquinone biosynthesis C-methylase UbiE
MNLTHLTDDEQATLWNGPSGRAWVETQDLLDQLFKPFEDLFVEAIAAKSRCRLLDVGCGTGSTTLAIARRLKAKDCCIGIDISGPMIAAARTRAERDGTSATFICANAQTHAFEPAQFNAIISRFGVMFFTNPVQAFAKLRRSANEGAELRLIAWRSAEENPFVTQAERAAAPLFPMLAARRPNAPGQFAFANQHRVHSILEQSHWTEIAIRPIDVACSMPEKELTRYLTHLGPVGMTLQEADNETRTRIIETIRPAFDPYIHGTEVRFNAACWMISARVQSAFAETKNGLSN